MPLRKLGSLAALPILILAGLSFALPQPDLGGGFMTLVPIMFFILILAEALLYMLAKVANMPRTEAWVKLELREIFITAAIGVLVLSAISAENAFVKTLTGEEGYQDAAIAYLDSAREDMANLSLKLTHGVYLLSKIAGWQYDISVGIGPVSTFRSAAPKAGLNALNTAVYGALDSLSQSIMILTVEKMFLLFFETFFLYLFPFALILRAMPMTRKLGGALLALAIGTYIAYPTSLVLAGEIYKEELPHLTQVDSIDIPDIGTPPGMGLICNKWMPIFTLIGEWGWTAIICPPICAASLGSLCAVCPTLVKIWYIAVHAGFSTSYAPKLKRYADVPLDQLYPPFNDKALPAVTQRFALTLVLLLFAAMLTIVTTKSVSEALGGEGQLYGLSRII